MQTRYPLDHSQAYPGTLADSRCHNVIPGNNDLTLPIPFGALVKVAGVGSNTYGLATADDVADSTVGGLALHDAAHEGGEGVAFGTVFNVLTQGTMHVQVAASAPANRGGPVYAEVDGETDRCTGAYTSTAAPGFVLVTGAVFRTSAPAGGVAVVEINLPGVTYTPPAPG